MFGDTSNVTAHLVFALLGTPWTNRAAMEVFVSLPRTVAVVIEEWKAFGRLPVVE